MTIKQVAMPEFLERQDIEPRAWSVQEGAPMRGDAWTEMRGAQMRVPFGNDELSRVVRAHELVHAKVSPLDLETLKRIPINLEVLICSEEFRVNMIVKHLGFNLDHLRDGSEPLSGEICGRNNDWNGMVRFIASTAGGKACKDFIRGVNKSNPAFAIQAKKIEKELLKKHKAIIKRFGGDRRGYDIIGATQGYSGEFGVTLPTGFCHHTLTIAKFLSSLMLNKDESAENVTGVPQEAPNVERIARGQDGAWGKLVELKLPKPKHVDGRLGRKRMATNVGKNPRRINRMLVDPEQRIFDRRAKGKGGIVLIDQSGSMRLDQNELWEIIKSAPGCVVIGYSHKANSHGHPNIWVMAERGKVIENFKGIPIDNGGNGVDGPALNFALAKRRNNEPFIWVCDGEVTDGVGDSYYHNLGVECAKIALKNNIHMVAYVEGAVNALQRVARGERLEAQLTGSVRTAGHNIKV